MKKKLAVGIALLGIVVIMVACGNKRPAATEAVESWFNAHVYDKEVEKYETYFHAKLIDETPVYDGQFGDEKMDKEMYEKFLEKIRTDTDYKVLDEKEVDGITTVKVELNVINTTQFNELMLEEVLAANIRDLNELGVKIERLDDIANLADEASLKIVDDYFEDESNEEAIMLSVVSNVIDRLEKAEKPVELTLKLKVNEDNVDAWEMIDHEAISEKVMNEFFNL